VFTIPNNVGIDSYKRGIENLLRAKNERHLLPPGEKLCAICSIKPTIYGI